MSLRSFDARQRAEIDADLAAMGTDVEYQREAAQIMAEFVGSDAAVSRLVDAEHGAYPYDEAELAELTELSRLAQAAK
ncbi:MAG TPA: hypothetical protein VFH48_25025 [Chloroflexota bacterium]|jgi:hypothetical protein|nr:hypothetical protein [Chloroflexota bacterium]